MIASASRWRACAQQTPVLSDDPGNRWPGCNLPAYLPHPINLARPSGSTRAKTARPRTRILSISIHKCYTNPSQVFMSAKISSCPQSWGTACGGLFPWKPYFAVVHNGFWLHAEWLMKKRSLHREDIWNVTKMSGCSHILLPPLFPIEM